MKTNEQTLEKLIQFEGELIAMGKETICKADSCDERGFVVFGGWLRHLVNGGIEEMLANVRLRIKELKSQPPTPEATRG